MLESKRRKFHGTTTEDGDVIAVLGTGAYNYAMAMNYNRVPRPAMIFISEGKDRLVVRRQTFEDLIECEL
jgi:diaminopimelate decarboxylase